MNQGDLLCALYTISLFLVPNPADCPYVFSLTRLILVAALATIAAL